MSVKKRKEVNFEIKKRNWQIEKKSSFHLLYKIKCFSTRLLDALPGSTIVNFEAERSTSTLNIDQRFQSRTLRMITDAYFVGTFLIKPFTLT